MKAAPGGPRTLQDTVKSRRPIGLASWLGGGSVVVVALAVAAMAVACALLLGKLAHQQALTVAELAATSARDQLRRLGERSLSDARVLAARPTLARMLGTADTSGLGDFLNRFCVASGADACVVIGPAGERWTAGLAAPWPEVDAAIAGQGERFIVAPADGSALLWGGTALLPGSPGWRAVVLRAATEALLQDVAGRSGTRIALTNLNTYTAPPGDPLAGLHAAALGGGRQVSVRLEDGLRYVAAMAVATVDGEVVGLLDATIDGARTAASLRAFNFWLAGSAALVALVAGLAGIAYGRWLARPVEALRDAAVRIGRGDFSVAMPAVAPSEIGSLAQTMDEMRSNLVALTATLREREAEARAVLGGVVEGVMAVDEDRRIRYANPQVATLLRRGEGDIVGRFCGDVLNPRSPDGSRPCEVSCPILAARSGRQGLAAETVCVANGTTRSLVVVSSPPASGQQVLVLRDETDLEAARRARDGVLGNISHEFRTPLAAQLAAIELLRDGVQTMDRGAQADLLANLQSGALRLMRLIDNLLESVRIESGHLEIRRQSLDLLGVIEEAVESVRPLLGQRGLRLEIAVPDAETPLAGDAPRLVQVFVNLLSNAIKFAPAGSTVRVGSADLADAVDCWVEDEGPGVAGGDAEAIFDRFRRSMGAEPDAPGLGLGLWIVKSIVERHGGTVRVERSADARTRFILRLPKEIAA